MARVDLLTLGYHAKSGLASKTDISVIVFGANVGEKCAERIRVGDDSVGCSTVPVPKPLSSLLKNPLF